VNELPAVSRCRAACGCGGCTDKEKKLTTDPTVSVARVVPSAALQKVAAWRCPAMLGAQTNCLPSD
jgi:hypothetical protein